jgi:ElaB/YqjD/DUF883 family membrane-anchored ribosome-binding protein
MATNKDSAGNEKIQQAMELLKEAAREKQVEFSHLLKNIYADAKDAQGRAVEKVKTVAGDVDKTVHKNPWAFIGGAALTGLVVGFLMRIRRGR